MAELKRVLNTKTLIFIIMSFALGSWLMFFDMLPSYKPSNLLLPYIVLCIISVYTATVISELIAIFPKSAGIYEFAKQAYGRFMGFITAWTIWLIGNMIAAVLIIKAISYLLPYNTPLFITVKVVVSLFWVIAFSIMAYKGIKTSSFMLSAFAFIAIAAFLIILVPSLFNFNLSGYTGLLYDAGDGIGLRSISYSIPFIPSIFFGLLVISFLSEETTAPEKRFPKALILSTVIIAVITILFLFISLGIIKGIQAGIPFFEYIFTTFIPGYMADILSLLLYLITIGAATAWILTGPRLILALSRDKSLIPVFNNVHHEHNSPSVAVLFQVFAISLFVLIGFTERGYTTFLSVLSPIIILILIIIISSMVVIRLRYSDVQKPFKASVGITGAVLLILFNILLLFLWAMNNINAFQTTILSISFIVAGVPVYILLESYNNPKSIRLVHDTLAYLALITENLSLPLPIRKQLIALIGDIKGKKILEFGCSVGTLTKHLAEEVGKSGLVYATDSSKKEIDIMKKRMHKRGHSHIFIFHDEHHHKRVHPHIPQVDAIVSVGMLGYVEDVDKVLKDMNKRLRNGSRICFLDYDKFFDIIPNVAWLRDNNKIKTIFYKAGFNVGVIRKQGFAWHYIFIYGTKFRDV